MSTTLLQLRTAARQRADMENSQFVQDSELTSYINQSYFELYDILVQKYGSNYFIQSPYVFTTDGVNQFFSLPTDFYKLAGISVQYVGANYSYMPIKQGSFADMQMLSGVLNTLPIWSGAVKYALQSNKIWLAPLPPAGQKVQLFYVPKLTPLSLDTDVVDGISGWDEYIVTDAAIKCMQKEESDVSILAAQKAALLKRIENAAANRDTASAATFTDVSDDNHNPWGRFR